MSEDNRKSLARNKVGHIKDSDRPIKSYPESPEVVPNYTFNIKVINLSKTLGLPSYSTPGAAAMDVSACFDCGGSVKIYDEDGTINDLTVEDDIFERGIVIPRRGRALIPTGLKVEIPSGLKIHVTPRSGLAIKNGVTVLNSPGLIDSDYRGIIGIILINNTNEPFEVMHGDRIAQIAVEIAHNINWVPADELSDTLRAEGGFGHTGK